MIPGRYNLTATNRCGAATDDIRITAGLCTVTMPTAVPPNGDGKKDLFRLKYTSFVQTFRLAVYIRWGQLVFSSTDAQKG